VLAQTEADATRLREAGARNVVVSGNLKFDMTPDEALLARGRAWRAAVGRPVVMAAATREGEEPSLLGAWARHTREMPVKPLLLVVPRHPQRFDEVAGLMAGAGLASARRSAWGDAPPAEALAADAWLGDSIGEMPVYYALAQVALLGGSYAPLGGQNLIEAAACGCPIVMGPHTFNFAEACRAVACLGCVDPRRRHRRGRARGAAAAGRCAAPRAGVGAVAGVRGAAPRRGGRAWRRPSARPWRSRTGPIRHYLPDRDRRTDSLSSSVEKRCS
jgi:3-deoxy-D-manno-octulosonic-acid transferase